MTKPTLNTGGHLSGDLLVRLLDDEFTGSEVAAVETHLTGCALCRERYSELRRASSSFDSFLASLQPAHSPWDRQQLAQKLDTVESRVQRTGQTARWRKIGWGVAVAAGVTLGVLLIPHKNGLNSLTVKSASVFQSASSAFDIDGETFVALPYSNPDLPMTAPHIVQMQVPVSSLAEAGIYVEPVGNRVSAPDRAVLANVLLGMDGQPLGVHVLSSD